MADHKGDFYNSLLKARSYNVYYGSCWTFKGMPNIPGLLSLCSMRKGPNGIQISTSLGRNPIEEIKGREERSLGTGTSLHT